MVRRTRPGISRFRVRASARPGMTNGSAGAEYANSRIDLVAQLVVPGLVPGIHYLMTATSKSGRRDTPGHDKNAENLVFNPEKILLCLQAVSTCPALAAKTFPFPPHPKHFYTPGHPVPHEGRIAVVTDVGRDVVDASALSARGIAGRVSREQLRSAQTRDATADGEVVWS
jgi:hypothetical protein